MEPRTRTITEPGQCACWACGAAISSADKYCKECGKGQGRFVPWMYKHWGVAALTLLTGPFSLYYVWRSPVIPRNGKYAYTALILGFTWAALAVFQKFMVFFQSMAGGMQVY